MGELMDGAIQHAPQCFLQSIEILEFQDIFNESKVTIYKVNVKLLTLSVILFKFNMHEFSSLFQEFLLFCCSYLPVWRFFLKFYTKFDGMVVLGYLSQ
jgi:hypothetical protein